MMQKGETATRFVVVILVVALVAAVSVLLHVLFSKSISSLTVEILAAVLGVVLVVASVGVTIHFQNRSEMERQFRVALFEKKLDAYLALLVCIARADDDGRIDDDEREEIRNHSEMIALVGGEGLVGTLSRFNEGISKGHWLDAGADDDSFTSLVQAMRTDLAVVDGDVSEFVDKLVSVSTCRDAKGATP